MKDYLKEPLLHFALLGVAFFALYNWVAPSYLTGADQGGEIIVTEGRIKSLVEKYIKIWQRPPTKQELDGVIEDHIKEEVLYREALANGLDRNDTIVRRRLRQKMEFLSEDVAGLAKPSDKELEEFLKKNPDRFRKDSRFSFRQVYINSSKRGKTAEADAKVLLEKLGNKQADPDKAGDSLMVQRRFKNKSESEIERALGKNFIKRLKETKTGSWQGPVESGFGLHLIHISNRDEGKVPPLADVREAVNREWVTEKQKSGNEEFYQELRKRYSIKIMMPFTTAPSDDSGKSTVPNESDKQKAK